MTQIKNSFDLETVKKILKGAAIAATGAFALFILDAIGKLQLDSPFLIAFIAWAVPTLTNLVKEWMKGEAKE